jgi:hypothetical protein
MISNTLTDVAPVAPHKQQDQQSQSRAVARLALVNCARAEVSLADALAGADEAEMFNLLQCDYQGHLAGFPVFADEMEFADPYVCSMAHLAELIAQAPTAVMRQTLREIAYCRQEMEVMLGLAHTEVDERTRLVLAGSNAEWEILLGAYPTFAAWLSTIDRFTCSRAMLADAILQAPTAAIRHALRETFCFRKVAALLTPYDFA